MTILLVAGVMRAATSPPPFISGTASSGCRVLAAWRREGMERRERVMTTAPMIISTHSGKVYGGGHAEEVEEKEPRRQTPHDRAEGVEGVEDAHLEANLLPCLLVKYLVSTGRVPPMRIEGRIIPPKARRNWVGLNAAYCTPPPEKRDR